MIQRDYWLAKIEKAWQSVPIVWLAGVRRIGKTTLAQMIPRSPTYFHCEIPSVRGELGDPEFFLNSLAHGTTVILDEIHRLDDPTLVLKLAADLRPDLKILATGSSTLTASKKFQDSLTGRKRVIQLAPTLWSECVTNFDVLNLDHRLLHGGFPEMLLATEKDPDFFVEWMDSLYARDIQELFTVRNRIGFLSLVRLLVRQSGGQLDYTKLARSTELSRPTVKSYIESLFLACVIHMVPPLRGATSSREIVSRPKCYTFDTGLITYERGWGTIRPEDRGILWEHLVLDMLYAHFRKDQILYWKDKSHREVDFIVRINSDEYHAVECKVNPKAFTAKSLEVFRSHYPTGQNFVVSPHLTRDYRQRVDGLTVTFLRDIKKIEQ